VLSSLSRHHNSPLAKCGCKKHGMEFHGDHTSTCTAHSGATKAHDWFVGVLGTLFRTAGHTVRTQHGVTTTARRRGDSKLPARPGWQPEPGLRPQHHPSLQKHPTPYLHSVPGVESSKVTSNLGIKSSKHNYIVHASTKRNFGTRADERHGSSSHPLQNGHLTHPQDMDAPLHIAAQRHQ
jgi:hypothetical protein